MFQGLESSELAFGRQNAENGFIWASVTLASFEAATGAAHFAVAIYCDCHRLAKPKPLGNRNMSSTSAAFRAGRD